MLSIELLEHDGARALLGRPLDYFLMRGGDPTSCARRMVADELNFDGSYKYVV